MFAIFLSPLSGKVLLWGWKFERTRFLFLKGVINDSDVTSEFHFKYSVFRNNFKNVKVLFVSFFSPLAFSAKFHFIRDRFERLCLSLVERTSLKIHPRPFKILSIRVAGDERGGVNKWTKFGNKRETWLTFTSSDTCSRISRFLRLLLFHRVLIVDEFYHFWCGLSRRDRTGLEDRIGT